MEDVGVDLAEGRFKMFRRGIELHAAGTTKFMQQAHESCTIVAITCTARILYASRDDGKVRGVRTRVGIGAEANQAATVGPDSCQPADHGGAEDVPRAQEGESR